MGTKPRRTRRTCREFKTWLTNSRSKSRPTNDKPRKPKKLPTPTCPNTENSSTSLMKPKNEPIWPNLTSTNSEPRPEDIKQKNGYSPEFSKLLKPVEIITTRNYTKNYPKNYPNKLTLYYCFTQSFNLCY